MTGITTTARQPSRAARATPWPWLPAGRDHAAAQRRRRQVGQLVVGAPQLEGKDRLQVLALQQHRVAEARGEPRRRLQRRLDRHVVDAGFRFARGSRCCSCPGRHGRTSTPARWRLLPAPRSSAPSPRTAPQREARVARYTQKCWPMNSSPSTRASAIAAPGPGCRSRRRERRASSLFAPLDRREDVGLGDEPQARAHSPASSSVGSPANRRAGPASVHDPRSSVGPHFAETASGDVNTRSGTEAGVSNTGK